jgi:hypothetical protein
MKPGAPKFAGTHDGIRQRCTLCGGDWQWNSRKNDGMWEHDWRSCKGWAKWWYGPKLSLFQAVSSCKQTPNTRTMEPQNKRDRQTQERLAGPSSAPNKEDANVMAQSTARVKNRANP